MPDQRSEHEHAVAVVQGAKRGQRDHSARPTGGNVLSRQIGECRARFMQERLQTRPMPTNLLLEEADDLQVRPGSANSVLLPAGDQNLYGELIVPPGAAGIIICAGPRTECVSEFVRQTGNATLRVELLTGRERAENNKTHSFKFDISLQAQRLIAATRWLAHQPNTAHLGFGYFGEELAGAAALVAAAELGVVVDAVVCRHARPDFAANCLPNVEAATLLICSKNDPTAVTVNRSAFQRLTCEKQLQVIPPPCNVNGTPQRDCVACSLAASWFRNYVRSR